MRRKLTKETFILKARKIHGDKYDYSKVKYINSRTPIIIICPVHGEFEQLPRSHLGGSGCNECVGNRGGHKKRNYLSFVEAKAYLIKLGFKNREEYWEWHKKNNIDFLPSRPDIYYKDG